MTSKLWRLVAGTSLSVVLVSACGNSPSGSTAANGDVEPPDPSPSSTLPLPPEGMPAIRDVSSLLLPADPGDSIAPGPNRLYVDYDIDRASAWETMASYYGFTGPFYSQLQWDRGITVLDKSLGVEPGRTWTGNVLARNDTLTTVGAITVTATLLDAKGQQLEQVQASTGVPEARPGEPVPVRLVSETQAEQVADVRFEALADAAPTGTDRRLRFIVDDNPAPYGHEEPQERLSYSERGLEPPLPYLECLAVTPTDRDVVLSGIDNVLAWQDGQGRLVYVAEPFLIDETDKTTYGDQTPFCVSVDDPLIAKDLTSFATLWWGVGESS